LWTKSLISAAAATSTVSNRPPAEIDHPLFLTDNDSAQIAERLSRRYLGRRTPAPYRSGISFPVAKNEKSTDQTSFTSLRSPVMFEPTFIVEAVVLFAIGLWPLLLVVAAAGVRWFNARRVAAAAAVHTATLPHAPARARTLAYAAGR
jgi:hypothetical protein